jgi:hypothetical protein
MNKSKSVEDVNTLTDNEMLEIIEAIEEAVLQTNAYATLCCFY